MKLKTLWALVRGTRWGAPPEDDGARLDAAMAMYATYREAFPEVPEISASDLRDALHGEAPPVLVDVRSDAERGVSTIPGAVSPERFASEAPEGPVVTYCTIGARSGEYAEKLRSEGRDVRNLAGSLLAWTHVGGELVDGDGPTRRVHVYGKRWDLVHSDYEGVY
ncbi:MAG: rhodanese-like domain-containing protein [Deltaproteobacteria bacterium]|nr:MAG: rhodanese-like domain-containing protein [Deltaproteobacteria bacterium]